MVKKKRIAVAVSGGVDSLCALLRLADEGHDVFAIHCLFLAQGDSDTAKSQMERRQTGLQAICTRLSIPLFFPDFSSVFAKEVIHPFIVARKNGFTPNPCVRCNQKIKFGLLLKYACLLGADMLATGHYTSCFFNQYGESSYFLLRRTTSNKDQTYFLALLSRGCLSHLVFPLGGMQKDKCREIVKKHGLQAPDSIESQDVCFINGDFRDYIKKFCPANDMKSGPVLLHGRRIATHDGLFYYTVGQRKGLGIPWREPLYVLEKDLANNALHLAEKEYVYMRAVEMEKINFFLPLRHWPKTLFAQWRHGGTLAQCCLETKENGYVAVFQKPYFPTSAGQLCAFYDCSGNLLGGGIVQKTHAERIIASHY